MEALSTCGRDLGVGYLHSISYQYLSRETTSPSYAPLEIEAKRASSPKTLATILKRKSPRYCPQPYWYTFIHSRPIISSTTSPKQTTPLSTILAPGTSKRPRSTLLSSCIVVIKNIEGTNPPRLFLYITLSQAI